MRAGWPSILFVSVALHVIGALGVLLASLTPGSKTAGLTFHPPTVTVVLRAEATVGRDEPASRVTQTKPVVEQRSVGIAAAPAKSRVMAAQVKALALREKTELQVRNIADSVLCPATAPTVDARKGIVFIMDVSGSMYEPWEGSTRLASARLLLGQRILELKDGTPFALAVYAESARRSGPLVPASTLTRAAAVQFLSQDYDFGGGTNLPLGLAQAAELKAGELILVTDGDLNMQAGSLLPRVQKILGLAGVSPALTIVAIAPRPHTDAERMLHALAQQQAGTYLLASPASLTASLTR